MTEFTAKMLGEGFLADVAGEVHGLVEDAGDFKTVPSHPIKNKVLGDSECPAAIGQIVSGFAAGEEWVVHDAGSRDSKVLKVSSSLFHAPSFEGVAKDFGKVSLCEV